MREVVDGRETDEDNSQNEGEKRIRVKVVSRKARIPSTSLEIMRSKCNTYPY